MCIECFLIFFLIFERIARIFLWGSFLRFCFGFFYTAVETRWLWLGWQFRNASMLHKNNAGRLDPDFIYVCTETPSMCAQKHACWVKNRGFYLPDCYCKACTLKPKS
jgi:hypothetical protein